MVTIQGQTLTERQKGLAACACLMAQGDLERLEYAMRSALNNGVTINGDPPEQGRAAHSSILPWRIPWREDPAGDSPWLSFSLSNRLSL